MESLITSSLLAVAIVLPILATLAVGLRFYAHRLTLQKLQAHDWTILIALLMCWAISINTFVGAGMVGVNTSKLEPIAGTKVFLKVLWIGPIPLRIGLTVIKISILLFYRHIFATKYFRLCVNIMIAVIAGWGISAVFMQIFADNPVSGAWNPVAIFPRFNYGALAVANASIGLVFNVMVLCFPLPVIKNLQMETKRKVILVGIFWLGAFCCVAAAIGLQLLYKEADSLSGSQNSNQYVFLTQSLIWSHIEPNCSIIAACLPTYGLLLKKRRSKFSKMRSPCSILSFGSWCSISGKGASDDPQNSASGSAKTEALGAKMARQQLENGNHSVNLTNVQLGSKRNDLEAQTGHSMEILVTKWFGIEHERA